MAKKIWAYAIDSKTEEYVVGEEHPLRMFFVWEASKLKREDPDYYGRLKFMSTQRIVEDRRPMNLHPNGFFRYNKGQAPSESGDQDTDNVSHMLAIAALSELKVLTFNCDGTKITIHPKTVELECRVQLITNGEYKYYVPDLVFAFNKNSHWAKKWGNKLAVEVKYTHACEDVKVADFLNHQIPIIEVDIKEYSVVTQFETKTPDESQLKEYFESLQSRFREEISGTLLSDPVSLGYFKEQVAKKNEAIKEIEASLITEKSKCQQLTEIAQDLSIKNKDLASRSNTAISKLRDQNEDNKAVIEKAYRQRDELASKLQATQHRQEALQLELDAERSKGFWARVFG